VSARVKRIEPGLWKMHDGRYQVSYRDTAGKRRAKHFDRLLEARNFKASVRVDKQRGTFVDPRDGKRKFSEWAETYMEQKIRLRPRTQEKYESMLRVHLLPAFGPSAIGMISRDDVQSWIGDRHREGYGAETVRGIYDLFAAIMRLAVEDGLIARSPCRKIELPAIIREEKRYLHPAQVEALVASVEAPFKALIYTAAYLGLRWQEIAGLRKAALNLGSSTPATVRVVTTIERARGYYTPVEYAKSKAARRTLKMPDFLRQALLWHLRSFGGDEWVFTAPKGGFLRYDNFRPRVWLPAVETSGLTPLTFHELRHTAAAFMINDGADPLQVKRRMGHEDIRTTFETYGHLFPDREDELVAALQERYRAARRSSVGLRLL
jgi:integrase